MSNMSNEKRFVLSMLLVFIWMMGWPYVGRQLGLWPAPKKPPVVADAGKDQEKKGEPTAHSEGRGQAGNGEVAGPGQEGGNASGRRSPQEARCRPGQRVGADPRVDGR